MIYYKTVYTQFHNNSAGKKKEQYFWNEALYIILLQKQVEMEKPIKTCGPVGLDFLKSF